MNTKQEALTPRQEIMRITELSMDITDLNAGKTIHCCQIGSDALNVTVFGESIDPEWQMNLYGWSHDEAFLPKLRFLRNELETMYQEALGERRGEAA